MTRIGTLILAVALVAFAGGMVSAREWKSIRIATEGEYPPFNQLDAKDQPIGFDVDIAKALCRKMAATCSFEVLDWDALIPSLNAGKVDAIVSSMSITPEREKTIDFTNKYYNTPPAIAVPKDSTITEATDEGLKGKTIGAQSSTTHANYASAHLKDAELKLYPSPDEYKLDLANGRIDAVIDDVVVLSEWVKSDAGNCCKMLGTLKIDPEINGIGAGIGLRKGDTALKDKFNAAIAAIRADGTYKKIQDKYFDFDVYGD